MERMQINNILKDLDKKIVFLVGPRQVGKTWLSKEVGKYFNKTTYFNYDNIDHRKAIENMEWLRSTDLLILDELHKMKDWKNYLKGVFDTRPENLRILVTGSARLDTFRQSGDSLAGRFFCHRLLPFSLSELKNTEYNDKIELLIERGGFPEPFFAKNEEDVKRWRNQYVDGLIRTDILDFEQIHDFKSMSLIFELLRTKVGSPVSFNSIAEDVKISPMTVKKYIDILEALYLVFKITPYSKNIARSILKEPKIYFFDTGLVKGNCGLKLENMVAVSLLKNVYARTDYQGDIWQLQYLRTKEGKEVDFCIAKDGDIQNVFEVKFKDDSISKNLLYFCKKYNLKGIQLVQEIKREREIENLKVLDARHYLKELYM